MPRKPSPQLIAALDSLPSDIKYLREALIYLATLPPYSLEDDPNSLNKLKKAIKARTKGLSSQEAHQRVLSDCVLLKGWHAQHKPNPDDNSQLKLALELSPLEGLLFSADIYCQKPQDLENFLKPIPKYVDRYLIETSEHYTLPHDWKRPQPFEFTWKGGDLIAMGLDESTARNVWRSKTKSILNPPPNQPPDIIPVETKLENPITIGNRTGYAIVLTCVGADGPWCLEYLLNGPDGWLDVRACTKGKFGKHVLPRAQIEELITHIHTKQNPKWRPYEL